MDNLCNFSTIFIRITTFFRKFAEKFVANQIYCYTELSERSEK